MNNDYTLHRNAAYVYPALKTIFARESDKIESLCHYTSTEVLDILLENATFRASNIFYLNDSSEYVGGIKKLKEIFKGYKNVQDLIEEISEDKVKAKVGVFSISFSEEYDLLRQWVTYAKESGVCIVLDGELLDKVGFRTIPKKNIDISKIPDELKNNAKYAEINNKHIKHRASNIVYRLIYDYEQISGEHLYKAFATMFDEEEYDNIDKINQICKEYADECWNNKELAKLYLQLIASYLKNGKFMGEKEIRAIFFAECVNCDEISKVYYNKTEIKYHRMKNGILRPYCDIAFVKQNKPSERVLPLKAIVVGPSGNQQTLFDSIVHRIKYGKKNVWIYDGESFKQKFIDYVCGSIDGYLYYNEKQLTENDAWKIFDILKNNWCIENNSNDKIVFNEKNKKEFLDKIIKKGIELKEKTDSDLDIDSLINEIGQSNYFSQEGIWVTKSKIPYIF